MKDRSRLKFANSFVDRGAHRRGFEPAHVFFFPFLFLFFNIFSLSPPIHSLFLLDFSASVWFLFKAKGSIREERRDLNGNGRQIRVAAALLFDKQIVSRLISFHLSASILRVPAPGEKITLLRCFINRCHA